MVLVENDVEVVVAVRVREAVKVHVLAPAVVVVPEEHVDLRARAVRGVHVVGVVPADRARVALDGISTAPAAVEVVDLEIAGGLVEPEVVEEVVREVQREEECGFGGVG